MPIEYQIDHVQRRVVTACRGALTETDFRAYQQDVWSRPDVAGYDELVDMTEAGEVLAATGEKLKLLAAVSAAMDARETPSKFAIVAPRAGLYGLGRMYATWRGLQSRSTKQVEVFKTMSEALAWLGSPVAVASSVPPPNR